MISNAHVSKPTRVSLQQARDAVVATLDGLDAGVSLIGEDDLRVCLAVLEAVLELVDR